MRTITRWLCRHATAVLRTLSLAAAVLCLWRAIAQVGSPEGSVALGVVAVVCVLAAMTDIDIEGAW